MGITIHYETYYKGGETNLRDKLNKLADFARVIGFAEVMPFYTLDYAKDFNEIDEHTPVDGEGHIDGSYRWAKIQARPRFPIFSYKDTPKQRAAKERLHEKTAKNLKRYNGLVLPLWFGEGCEATNLCFIRLGKNRTWKGASFTKTQYAKEYVKAHCGVCTILKAAEKEGIVHSVYDEAGYYETGDITQLIDSGEENLRLIAGFCDALKVTYGEDAIEGAGKDAKDLLKDYEL